MAIAIHRVSKELRESAHTPDFPTASWVVYGRGDESKIAALRALRQAGIPMRHIKFNGQDNPLEMTPAEKLAVDQSVIRLDLSSNASADFDGIPAVDANGVETHTITVRKLDLSRNPVNSGSEQIRIVPSAPILAATSVLLTLVNGTTTFVVGPTLLNVRGEVSLTAIDPLGILKQGKIKIRFK